MNTCVANFFFAGVECSVSKERLRTTGIEYQETGSEIGKWKNVSSFSDKRISYVWVWYKIWTRSSSSSSFSCSPQHHQQQQHQQQLQQQQQNAELKDCSHLLGFGLHLWRSDLGKPLNVIISRAILIAKSYSKTCDPKLITINNQLCPFCSFKKN